MVDVKFFFPLYALNNWKTDIKIYRWDSGKKAILFFLLSFVLFTMGL